MVQLFISKCCSVISYNIGHVVSELDVPEKKLSSTYSLSVVSSAVCFVVIAEIDDNTEQIKKDLHMFLYHLRLPAEVFVVPLVSKRMSVLVYCMR